MTLFWNRQVPSLAWAPPHLLCSLPCFTYAPHLCVPSPSALPILSTQTRGSKGELPPPFPGPPHTHTPLHAGLPTCMAAPCAPPISAPSPHSMQMGAQEGQCTHPVSSAQATPLCAGHPTHVATPFAPPPPVSTPSPCFMQMGVQNGQCAHPVPSTWAMPPQPPVYMPHPAVPACPPPLHTCHGVQE